MPRICGAFFVYSYILSRILVELAVYVLCACVICRYLLARQKILPFNLEKLVVREREEELLSAATDLSAREPPLKVSELLLEIMQFVLLVLFARRMLALE